ncbi:hypothetical protein POM88_037799 [Heracleum sosnowskyi]|uniref:Uncharacterized protein n=1 Tax=Heracleum sosnowskyi TaxID=360622 RepID=A0AAD8HQS2_9APIA|nr:hypothetical protein POM88_037799 [Heracleum sosnowskyi]
MELPPYRRHFDVVVAYEDDDDNDIDIPQISIYFRGKEVLGDEDEWISGKNNSLVKEMDKKVEKKVRENVKMMMSKLAEKCPELKVDIEELSVAPSNSVQDGDASGADNDTP